MSKYNYNTLYDPQNALPKRLPNIDSANAATTGMQNIGIPYDSTVDVDDAKEYWNGSDLTGIYGISIGILYYARFGNLNSFIP